MKLARQGKFFYNTSLCISVFNFLVYEEKQFFPSQPAIFASDRFIGKNYRLIAEAEKKQSGVFKCCSILFCRANASYGQTHWNLLAAVCQKHLYTCRNACVIIWLPEKRHVHTHCERLLWKERY